MLFRSERWLLWWLPVVTFILGAVWGAVHVYIQASEEIGLLRLVIRRLEREREADDAG